MSRKCEKNPENHVVLKYTPTTSRIFQWPQQHARNQIRFHEEEDRQDLVLYRCRSIRHQQIYSAINMYTETQSLIFLAWFICIQDWKASSDFPISKYPCHWDPRKVIQEWWAINIVVPKEWLATAPTSKNKTSNNFLFTNTPSCMKLAASKTPI